MYLRLRRAVNQRGGQLSLPKVINNENKKSLKKV